MDEEDDADVGGLLIPLYLDFKLAISFLYFWTFSPLNLSVKEEYGI
jgi:hypothetical protein